MQKSIFPNRVTVELTNRCNISCTFCPRQATDMSLGNMDWELFKKIIDEMSEHLPIALVPFFRGESLLHPQFNRFMKYAKDKGIGPIQMFSNGLAFDNQTAEDIIRTGVDFISFSLDTLDEEIYKKSRVSGDLHVSMENVRNLCLKCREYKAKGLKVPEIQVSTIDVPEYKNGQEDFIAFWKEYADIVRVYLEHDENGQFVDSQVSDSLNLAVPKRKACHKIYTNFIIYWDGTVALCNYDWNNRMGLGNINNRTISEIWDSEAYENIRRMHEKGEIEKGMVCDTCEHWKADYLEQKHLGKAIYANKSQ